MHTTNYHHTLITPAADCRARRADGKPGTVGALQRCMLEARPAELTSDDLLWAVHCLRAGAPSGDAAQRDAFFSKPMACLRASPLVKTMGWGLFHDVSGRVRLIDPDGPDFARMLADPAITKLAGMRSSRAT